MNEFEHNTTKLLIEIKEDLAALKAGADPLIKQVERHEVLLNDGETGIIIKTEANTGRIKGLAKTFKGHLDSHVSTVTTTLSVTTVVLMVIGIYLGIR